MLNIAIYNEFKHEREVEECKAIYPDGIHAVLADFLGKGLDCSVSTFTLDNVNTGLNDEVLSKTDVLLWWGHMAHHMVSDEVAELVYQHVLKGMGAIFLHSAHMSKPFIKLMGTSCTLRWREAGEKELLWVTDPTHPIAHGINDYIELPQEETYGEFFDIPTPDSLVFVGWFRGGNVFRSGCAYRRGMGRVFYFQPGHETHPTYKHPQIQKILLNAVKWAAPMRRIDNLECHWETTAPESEK